MTLDQFITKYLGKQVEYHSYNPAAKFQCVDLVNQYIVEVWGLEAIIGIDAKDFPERLKTGMEYVANTDEYIPEVGEIAVWNSKVGNGAGHIAVVRDRGLPLSFKSLDQNWSKPLYVTQETHNYTNVRGFIRKVGAMANELETCMADRKKFWVERDDALAKLASAHKEIELLDDAIKNRDTEIAELKKELASKPAEDKTWTPNGKSVTTVVGNVSTTINYALK